jgi:hypothetical protein
MAGLVRPSPATQAGSAQPSHMGQVGPSLKKSKKFFFKICDFSQIFYCILIDIGLYFYTVKIQIRYEILSFHQK